VSGPPRSSSDGGSHLPAHAAAAFLLPVEIGRLADPCLAADLSHRRSFLALLDDERLLRVRELRCLHAKPPCPAKENYGGKLYPQMAQLLGGRAIVDTSYGKVSS